MNQLEAREAGAKAFAEGKPYEAATHAPLAVRPYWKAGYMQAKKAHAEWLTTPEGIAATRAQDIAREKHNARADLFIQSAFFDYLRGMNYIPQKR